LNGQNLSYSLCWNAAESVFEAIFKNERDGFGKTLKTLFATETLAVRTWNFGAKTDEPLFVSFDDGSELVTHKSS
jgi:hypothetical protein